MNSRWPLSSIFPPATIFRTVFRALVRPKPTWAATAAATSVRLTPFGDAAIRVSQMAASNRSLLGGRLSAALEPRRDRPHRRWRRKTGLSLEIGVAVLSRI